MSSEPLYSSGSGFVPTLAVAALFCAAVAAAILIWYLVARPRLVPVTKVVLFLGLGAFPIAAAFSGNLAEFEHTKSRAFCGSCHVMTPYAMHAGDLHDTGLPALHSRNRAFGEESCYACHSDYGMYGTALTKLAGMKHVWMYLRTYRAMSLEEALPTIHLYRPFPNASCLECHSTTLPGWLAVDDHRAMDSELRAGEVSCVSEGCHGFAHPFAKVGRPGPEHPSTSTDIRPEGGQEVTP